MCVHARLTRRAARPRLGAHNFWDGGDSMQQTHVTKKMSLSPLLRSMPRRLQVGSVFQSKQTWIHSRRPDSPSVLRARAQTVSAKAAEDVADIYLNSLTVAMEGFPLHRSREGGWRSPRFCEVWSDSS